MTHQSVYPVPASAKERTWADNDTYLQMYRASLDNPTAFWAEHGQRFIAAVENGPLVATQFHPEKSAEYGLRLYKNFVSWQP